MFCSGLWLGWKSVWIQWWEGQQFVFVDPEVYISKLARCWTCLNAQWHQCLNVCEWKNAVLWCEALQVAQLTRKALYINKPFLTKVQFVIGFLLPSFLSLSDGSWFPGIIFIILIICAATPRLIFIELLCFLWCEPGWASPVRTVSGDKMYWSFSWLGGKHLCSLCADASVTWHSGHHLGEIHDT